MHVAVRKNELDRISKENTIIAKKIYFAGPKIQTTVEMQNEFHENRHLVKNMSKIKRRTIGPMINPGNTSMGTVSRNASKRSIKVPKNSELSLPPIQQLPELSLPPIQ